MEKHSYHNGKWNWFRIDVNSEKDISALQNLAEVRKGWVDLLQEETVINLEMETTKAGRESMWGSLIYHQRVEEREKQKILYFHLSPDTLITNFVDVDYLYRISDKHLAEKMQSTENAVEGFMILLGEIVASFLQDIDAFENRMHDLLWRLKSKNDEDVFEQIMDNRHEILVWKNLIIPVLEIRQATLEAFGDSFADSPHYKRTYRRISRCREIIREYDEEIREMIDLETVISSHRGNEIVKTLTIITMLFTPIAAWGALWGMNFDVMPELKWRFGYLGAILVILLSTWGLYYYLKKKNWIGSLLKGSNNEKF